MKNICVTCGVEFESPRKRPYCSEPCRHKANYIRKEVHHVCLFCGKEFVSSHDETQFCCGTCRKKYKRIEQADVKKCRVCDKEIGILTERQYCSKECQREWDKTHPRHSKECPECGVTFYANDHRRIYCSRKCRNKSKASDSKIGICKNCNKEFEIKRNDVTTFCSRECSYQWRRNNKKQIVKEPTLYNLICNECGNEFKANRKKTFCSDECKQKSRCKTRKEYKVVCEQCGEEFVTTNKQIRYCSDICKKKHKHLMDYTRRDKRLAKNGKVDYSITLEKLYQRDKGICHICRQKVDMNANPNSDMYGSIDHMKPISKGGSHEWNNVKLAHRCCNNIKSNSDYYITKTGQVAMSV